MVAGQDFGLIYNILFAAEIVERMVSEPKSSFGACRRCWHENDTVARHQRIF
jgi:hypothetical protein